MVVEVRAHPGSKQKKIEVVDSVYKVYIHEKAADGKANEAIIELLAEHFKTAKSNIVLKSGARNRNKLFELQS